MYSFSSVKPVNQKMSTRIHKEVPGMRNVSPCPSEDDNLSTASPKRGGRKESEQKRRVMMNQYFDELIALLSMLSERCIPKKMDKATTLHEAVQCIQIYSDLTSKPEKTLTLDTGKNTKPSTKRQKSPSPQQTDTSSESSDTVQGLHTVGELLHFFLDANDAFLLVISDSGRVLFSTELVTSLLGHMQTRLVGQNVFDIIHENDHKLFQDLLKSDQAGTEGVKLKDRPIIAFPPKVVHFHLKLYAGETGYFPQYLQFMSVVYLRKWDTDRSRGGGGGFSSDMSPPSPDRSSSESGYSLDQEHQTCLVVIGKLPTSLSMVDLPVGTNDVNFEFDMRVSREGRVIDIDKHAVTVLGYTTSEIIGTSFFDYIDPYHLIQVSEVMSTFLSNGLGTTTPYRLLTKGGRSVWLISKGYLSYNPWNNKPDHILLTNRVLGCDQVLPEHRFFRSRRLLPDLEGHECYRPNIPVSRSSPPTELQQQMTTSTTNLTTSESAIHDNILETQFNLTDLVAACVSQEQHQAPPPHHQHHQGQGMAQHIPPNMNFQGQVANTQSLLLQGQLEQPQQGGRGGEGQQQQILHTPQCGPSTQTPVTPSPLQRNTGMSDGPLPSTSTTSSIPPATTQATTTIQNFEDIQRELERKNREIFEMQKKLYEQQQLFEKERSQFYSITAQVMQCISSNALPSQLTPNMQMVFSTSNEYNPSGMLTTQSKVIMDEPLNGHSHGHGQPATHGNFSSDSVRNAGVPLWVSGGSSLGAFTNTSQQYPVQQHSHQRPQNTGQQQTQQHHLQQSPYSTTPVSSMASSSVNFTTSDFLPPGNTTNVSSTSSMQPGHHNHSNTMLSEQFGLSRAFKMSGQQSLAEHNMQFYHHIPSHQQSQQSRQTKQQTQTHLPSIPGTDSPGYGSLMSNNILSNLSSSPSSSMSLSLPSLPAGMHTQQKQQQQTLPPQNLADVLNSVRFS